MERSLKDYDDNSILVNKDELIEEIALVTIVESENVRFDENFRIQERVVDYNLDDENVVTKLRNDEVFLQINNDL